MDSDRRQWLEQIAQATQRAVDALNRLDAPQHHRELLEDLKQLQQRLSAELREGSG